MFAAHHWMHSMRCANSQSHIKCNVLSYSRASQILTSPFYMTKFRHAADKPIWIHFSTFLWNYKDSKHWSHACSYDVFECVFKCKVECFNWQCCRQELKRLGSETVYQYFSVQFPPQFLRLKFSQMINNVAGMITVSPYFTMAWLSAALCVCSRCFSL